MTEHEGNSTDRVEWRQLKPAELDALDLSGAEVFTEAGRDEAEAARWFVKDKRVYVEYPGERLRLSVLHPSNLRHWPNFVSHGKR